MASTIKVDKIEGSTGSTITIPTGQTLTITDGVGVASGGTGLSSFTAGDLLYATGATTLVKLAKGTTEQTLKMNTAASAPEYGTANAIAGGTGQTTWAAGDLLYANGTNTLTKLTKPGSTMNLQMTSAGVPSWVAASSGGAWTLISTTTITTNTATCDFTSFSSDYTDFMVIYSGVESGGDGEDPFMHLSVGSGFVTSGTDYLYGNQGRDSGNSNDGHGSTGTSKILFLYAGTGSGTGEAAGGQIILFDVHSTTLYQHVLLSGLHSESSGVLQPSYGGGVYKSQLACDGISLGYASGIDAGKFTLYGRKLT